MASKLRQLDMTHGRILPQVVRFALPVALTNILQLLFNTADTMVVGRFANSFCMAAIGSTTVIVSLLVNAALGISTGTNVLIARHLGARQENEVSDIVHNSITLSLLLGLGGMLAGFFLSAPLLRLLNTPDELIGLASRYLKIYFIGVPGTMVYNFGAAVLRANGDTRRPMRYLTLSGIVNVILNIVTVVFLHMDVEGVAIATVVSQYLSMFLLLRCLMNIEGCSRLEIRKLRLQWASIGRILRIGFPCCIESILFSVSNVIITRGINSFGSGVVAASTAVSNLESFISSAVSTGNVTAVTFVSQNYGAREFARMRKVRNICLATFCCIGIVLGVSFYCFGRPLLRIFVRADDPNYDIIMQEGMLKMLCIFPWKFTLGMQNVGAGSVRGLGKTWQPMVITLVGTCFSRVIWMYTIFRLFHYTFIMYILFPITWGGTGLFYFFYFQKNLKKLEKDHLAAQHTA